MYKKPEEYLIKTNSFLINERFRENWVRRDCDDYRENLAIAPAAAYF